MPIHIMPDIETLSTNVRATVLTLGACAFDLDTGEIVSTISLRFSLEDQKLLDRHICPKTMKWWSEQNTTAREEAFRQDDAKPVVEAVSAFDAWVVEQRGRNPAMKTCIWANDPDFDLVILTSLFRDVGKEPPWQYWESRSVRTMKMIGEMRKVQLPKRGGTHHNAVDDAVHQAKVVSAVWGNLKP